MDLYSCAPISAVLDGAYSGVIALADLLTPVVGDAAAALAIVVVTVLVRTVLIPVGVSQARAEAVRRRLAPKLAELRRRHRTSPERLRRATVELYAAERSSPFAGCLPALAQAPVISLVYGLFVLPTIAGRPNALLGAELFGVPLGGSFAAALAAPVWPDPLVFAALTAVLTVVAWATRRTMVRTATVAQAQAQAPALPGMGALSWLPFATVAFAAVVPLAATVYLTVTSCWALAERTLLRRRFGADVGGPS